MVSEQLIVTRFFEKLNLKTARFFCVPSILGDSIGRFLVENQYKDFLHQKWTFQAADHEFLVGCWEAGKSPLFPLPIVHHDKIQKWTTL